MTRTCRVGVERSSASSWTRARPGAAQPYDQEAEAEAGAAEPMAAASRPRRRRWRATRRSIDRLTKSPGRTPGIAGAGQIADNDEVADTGARQSGDLLGGHSACHENRNTGACAGLSDVAQPGAGTAGLGGCGLHGPRRDVGHVLGLPHPRGRPGRASTGPTMASGPRIRRASATGASSWPDVHAVRPRLEREVGTVVQHEGHAQVAAHGQRHCGPGQQRPGLELLVTELDHVHPAGDAVARGRWPGRAGPACRGRGGAPRGRGAAVTPRLAPSPWPWPSSPSWSPSPWPGSRGR